MIWLKKVCDFAVEHDRTPIFWDDMPLKYADLWWLLHRPLTDDEIRKNWNTSRLDEAYQDVPEELHLYALALRRPYRLVPSDAPEMVS